MTRPTDRSRGLKLLVAGYLALGLPAAWHARHLLTADGLAYIQTARHYAAGRLELALNGYWSPLLCWLLVPAVWLGANPLTAAHLLVTACGLLWIAGGWLVCRRLELEGAARVAALAVAGAIALAGSLRYPTPDVLATGLLLLYLHAVSDPELLDSPRGAARSGLLGGLAFLAKAFAGPFFLAHFTAVVALRCWAARRLAVRCWLTGLLCAACLALPWIATISLHRGRLTISDAGRANHALVGPRDAQRWHPWIEGLWIPAAGRLTVWEDPSVLPYPTWSPFASRDYFLHQLRILARSLVEVPLAAAEHDPLRLRWLALLGLLVGLIPLRSDRPRLAGELVWLLAIGIHWAGYLPVQSAQPRYHWLPAALLVLLAFRLVARTRSRLLLGLLLAGAAAPLAHRLAQHAAGVPRGVEFAHVAREMRRQGCRGPLASSDFRYGLYVAWRLDLVALGQPRATTIDALERELRTAGVRTFVVWGGYPLADQAAHARWLKRVAHLPRGSVEGLRWDATVYRVRR